MSKLHSGQSFSQNKNVVDASKKLLKNRNWNFPVVRYFTRICLKYFVHDCRKMVLQFSELRYIIFSLK